MIRSRRPARAVAQLRALIGTSRAGAAAYGCSPLRIARIAARVRRRQAFEYPEALRVGALDPAISDAERAAYVSRHANLEAQGPLNGGNETPAISGDKSVFYRYCALLGVPVPALHGILDTRGSSWDASGRVLVNPGDVERFLAEGVPAEVIVKPSDGYAGLGVRLVVRDASGAISVNGRPSTVARLWQELRADAEFAVWIVQERLVNHPDLMAMGGSASLHSVRVNTIVARDGTARLLFANLKLALGGDVSDNFQGGVTGNGICQVGLEDGRLGPLVLSREGPAGLVRRPDSPLTGAPVEGVVLPHWEAATRIVVEAAPRFLPHRALGWDVALTPRGPVVLETNTRWLPLPYPSMPRILAEVLAEGPRAPSS